MALNLSIAKDYFIKRNNEMQWKVFIAALLCYYTASPLQSGYIMIHSPTPAASIILYGFALSGHCHRVELFLSLTRLPYQVIPVDLRGGEQKRPEFLKLNRFGQVPVIDDAGTIIADSNAILVYLSIKYGLRTWYPEDPIKMARIQRWLSVAAGPLAFGPAMARSITLFRPHEDAAAAIQRATQLFTVMNQELDQQPYLTGNTMTIADVAMYSYTAHAPEGNVSLEPYPYIRAWLTRIEALPGFIAMAKPPDVGT
jgi:glutathione S-transferase